MRDVLTSSGLTGTIVSDEALSRHSRDLDQACLAFIVLIDRLQDATLLPSRLKQLDTPLVLLPPGVLEGRAVAVPRLELGASGEEHLHRG